MTPLGGTDPGSLTRAVPLRGAALSFSRMHRPRLLLALAVAAAVAGCRAPRGQHPAPAAPGPAASAPRPSDADLDRIARAHAAYGAGIIRQMHEDSEGMLRYWTDSLRSDPANVDLATEVARRRLTRKETAAAVQVLEAVRKGGGVHAEVETLLGHAYVESGRRDDAVAAYRRALGADPGDLSLYSTLARVLSEGSRVDEAMALLKEAAARPGVGPGFLVELAEIYGQLEKREPKAAEPARAEALALLGRVAAANPKDPQLLNRLGERYAALGKKEEAEKFFQESRVQAPRNPLAAARLAEMYLQSGRLKEAAQQLEALRREDPTNPAPLYFLGLVAFEEHDYDRAAEMFRRTLLLDGTNESAHLDLVSALLSAGKASDALEALQKARTRIKPGFRLEFLQALTHGRLKDYEVAYEHFHAAEAIAKETNPKLVDNRFLFQVGAVLEEGHREELAEQYLKRSLEMEPDFAPALNHLGYMWADKGVNLEKARSMIERAVKLDPENAAYLDSLGWVVFRMGRPDEALPLLQKAAKLLEKEPDATVLDHIGDVLAALKRWDEAKDHWKRSLAIEASDAVRQKLESAPK